MKQIKLKNKHFERTTGSYMEQYLNNLGIIETQKFLNKPDNDDLDNPEQLLNIKEAADTLVTLMNNNVVTFVQVDSDADGYTSASVLINYLKQRWPDNKIIYHLHKDKKHGVILDTIPDECKLILIPDAGSNQFDEHRQLVAQGKTVIVLDHHVIANLQDSGAIIVNNQISDTFSNKFLSGAGVVYMLAKYLDTHYFHDNLADRYLDLVAVGVIADAMLMTTYGNNYIAYHGLNNINSPFLKELIKKQERGIKDPERLTKTEVAFYIAPVINGCIRSGEVEDKEILFKAMCEENNTDLFDSEWRGVKRTENLYEYAVRLATNAKSRQDNYKKKAFSFLCDYVETNELYKHNIIIIPLTPEDSKKVTSNLTGLVATELVKQYNKPVLVLRDTEYENQKMFGGSGRNGNFFKLPSLLRVCKQLPTYYAEGHDNAFGIFITPENVQAVEKYFDENFVADDFLDVLEVDSYFGKNDLIDIKLLREIASHDYLWGSGIPEPKLAFDIKFNRSNITIMGKDKSSVKIKTPVADFVLFKDVDTATKLANSTTGEMTIVGRPQVNEWMGKITMQILIDDFEITNIEDNLF